MFIEDKGSGSLSSVWSWLAMAKQAFFLGILMLSSWFHLGQSDPGDEEQDQFEAVIKGGGTCEYIILIFDQLFKECSELIVLKKCLVFIPF